MFKKNEVYNSMSVKQKKQFIDLLLTGQMAFRELKNIEISLNGMIEEMFKLGFKNRANKKSLMYYTSSYDTKQLVDEGNKLKQQLSENHKGE